MSSKESKETLDKHMLEYLDRRSCTPLHWIYAHFELHPNKELEASLDRLKKAGRVSYDKRRDGYQTHRPPAKA